MTLTVLILAHLWLPSMFAAALLTVAFTHSPLARRLAGGVAVACALLLGGVYVTVYAQPIGDTCANCVGWFCCVIGCKCW